MYVRGYLQGSENGRVVTIGYTPCICRSYVDTINSIQGRHIQAVIPRLHGYMDTNTINKGIRDETIKKFLLNRKSTKKGWGQFHATI